MKKAKEEWIGAQCEEIETCLNKNNSKKAYQLVKDLTSEKQSRSSAIQDKSRKETDSIKFKISSKTPRGKKNSTKRHHHRHHKR